jgi:outer membrane immunogenic protein
VLSWTGFYIGLHAGHASADADWTFRDVTFFNDVPGDKFSHDPIAQFGGGQIGFNRQVGRWVWGMEGTLSAGSIRENSVSPFFPRTDTLTTNIETLWTMTGRLGYAWDRWLAYSKAGYAGGRVETSASARFSGNFPDRTESDTEVLHGWTVGGGVEYLLAQNLVLGIEYNYIDLGKATYFLGDSDDRVVNDVTTHAVMGRLSYKFGAEGSVPLK